MTHPHRRDNSSRELFPCAYHLRPGFRDENDRAYCFYLEVVYFTIELFQSAKFFGNITWNTGESDGRDSDARTAFSSLFKISLRNPDVTPEYRNVTDEIKRRSENIFGYTFALEEEVNPFAMANYYALVIFAQVVNQTIALGRNPLDGGALNRLMWNRTYTILGQDIILNANGDREADWALNQMDVETGNFVPVMEYSAKRKALESSRNPVDNSIRKIVWYKRGSPPPNEPKCGYRGTSPDCLAKGQGTQYSKIGAAGRNLLDSVNVLLTW
ncbi:atrial natriuretic peptide receptor 1-like [Paramacrobiotus metropolitanus]|uniref:atrial natriuretic peptide receptor 1-like n=1 Tax=Paramacrobiotus metropolitanus TaxID=2943436 RepID=UPI00244562E3|nr:atrial natriuretic peptide receptor 1-like [Paramacrobiotus metropolitanus]